MHPIICQIGPLTIYSYGVMLAVAVFICTFLLEKEARKSGVDSNFIFDFCFWVVVSGIIGCRIFYILLNFSYFIQNPSEIIMLQRGGLAWQGGLIAGTLTALWLINKQKLSIGRVLDLVAPYIALGQAIGRLGCFLNGCCFGREAPWGIYFPAHHARLHPTQLYESAGLLLIFFILKKFHGFKKNDGEIFVLYLVLASFERFIVEFFRADHTEFWWGLSIFQAMSLCFMTVALYAYLSIKSRRGK